MNSVPLGLPFTVPASEATMETNGSITAGCWRSAEGREGEGEESGGGKNGGGRHEYNRT